MKLKSTIMTALAGITLLLGTANTVVSANVAMNMHHEDINVRKELKFMINEERKNFNRTKLKASKQLNQIAQHTKHQKANTIVQTYTLPKIHGTYNRKIALLNMFNDYTASRPKEQKKFLNKAWHRFGVDVRHDEGSKYKIVFVFRK